MPLPMKTIKAARQIHKQANGMLIYVEELARQIETTNDPSERERLEGIACEYAQNALDLTHIGQEMLARD